MCIENTNIKIKISLPSLVSVLHNGNNRLIVNGINGDYFRIKCMDNGSATLSGCVKKLTIVCTGNGTVNARKLVANNIETTRRGNGNIYTSKEERTATESNEGNKPEAKMVKVIIKNNTGTKVSLSVKYPISGSYGIGVNANDSIAESFPIGTKIYRRNQFTVFKKALFEIRENSADKPLIIK
jgi:hypothetical protein